jgi:uncharacterized peroxidase-related enzyme
MAQRIQGITDEQASGIVKEMFAGATRLLGRTANLFRILAHSPYLARWFLPLVASVRQPNAGAVSAPRLRNLAVLKTSTLNGCKYCTTHNLMHGQLLGLTDAEFAALQGDYKSSPLFDEREKAVLAWAEAMTLNTAPRDHAAWGAMRRLFTDAEIVEISLIAAMFNMINRLNDSLWTELEPEEVNRRQKNAVGVTAVAIEEYVRGVCTGEDPAHTRRESAPAADHQASSFNTAVHAAARFPRS